MSNTTSKDFDKQTTHNTTDSKGEALKPCPFCPSTRVMMWVSEKDGEKCCCGFCEECQAEGPHANTEIEAARLWNTRSRASLAAVEGDVLPRQEVVARIQKQMRLWNNDTVTMALADVLADLKAMPAAASSPAPAGPVRPNTEQAIALLTKWLNEDPEVDHDELLERLLKSINENSLSNRGPAQPEGEQEPTK